MFNRKGQGGKVLIWIFVLVVFSILFFGLGFGINAYASSKAYTPKELKAELISLRFVNLPECFALHTLGKTLPGVIDMNKFNDEQMSQCYMTESIGGVKTFNFRLVLEREGSEVVTDKYYNHDDFTLFQEVLTYKGNILSKDRLIIYVQEESTDE
ncbi:hypothetical protein HYT52_04980 [Candidatus Woesearchaeota archaeon]|nr:hypothetical protein [Candidatus Woesearchaeota archaeon]